MKRQFPEPYIKELEKAILIEIIRTKDYLNSPVNSDRKGRKSAETLLTLAHAWNLLTQRGVE